MKEISPKWQGNPVRQGVVSGVGADAKPVIEWRKAHNCIRPPHFPPHCGCPAYTSKEK